MPSIEQSSIVPGDILEGKVQGITSFGAFIELPGGAVGLVHISEIANTYVKDVKDFIKEGDAVKVKVLSVAGKKIGLSVKQAMVPVVRNTGPKFNNASGFKREAETNVPNHNAQYNTNRISAGGRMSSGAMSNKALGAVSLDDKIAKFLKESDERMQPLKNKIEPKKRNRNY
ncbi:MAG: S1 RNA-binding domain-containing protein [Syntrophomonadaceae bacterium]|jgi:S1 RNA binding domain protein|nr:S1 RNA-binding domain-containing protein [Syntrophomonadaceae bacterium]